MINTQALIGGGSPGGPGVAGMADLALVEELNKALTSGYGTDAASFTGGRALQPESLENYLITTTFEFKDEFILWGMLKKSRTPSVVDMWNERSDHGGSRYGAAVGETSNPNNSVSTLARKTANVKYLRVHREISHVMTVVDSIPDAIAEEEESGTLSLLRTAEKLFYVGNSTIIPQEYDGLDTLVGANSSNVIDVYRDTDGDGGPLTKKLLANAGQIIRQVGYGRASALLHSTLDQIDLDMLQDTKERTIVPISKEGEGVIIGAPAAGINLISGVVKFHGNVFIEPGATAPAAATPGSGVPITPTLVSAVAGSTGSQFTGAFAAKNYYYKVTAVNAYGESAATSATNVATVASGEQVTVRVTTADATTTGFNVYRSKGGAASGADCRFMKSYAYGDGDDNLVDTNADLPGTTRAYMLNTLPQYRAIDWRQLLPLIKFPLAITAPAYPFLLMLYGYMRVTKPKQHVLFKNIVPTGHDFAPV